jgi:alpha-methylacyl-CoA racemase
VPPAIPLADLIGGGLIPALTAVALVLQARATGRGGYVDASITDNMALLPSVLLGDLVAGIPVPPRADQTFLSGALACYDVYRLADGYAVVGALENQFWENLCRALGHLELVQLQWVESAQPQVRAVVAEKFAALTRADVKALGLEDQACVSVVRSFEDALLTQEAADRGVTVTGAGGVRALGLPFRIDGKRLSPAAGAPARGADTTAVLRELGVGDEEIARLRAGGIIAENGQSAL